MHCGRSRKADSLHWETEAYSQRYLLQHSGAGCARSIGNIIGDDLCYAVADPSEQIFRLVHFEVIFNGPRGLKALMYRGMGGTRVGKVDKGRSKIRAANIDGEKGSALGASRQGDGGGEELICRVQREMSIRVAEIDGEVTELAAIDDQRPQKVVHGDDGLVPRAGRRMHLYEVERVAYVKTVDSDISTCAVRGGPCLDRRGSDWTRCRNDASSAKDAGVITIKRSGRRSR